MDKYETIIKGQFEYDMMPRVYKVILVGKGHIEDYEIELDVFDISTKKVQRSCQKKVDKSIKTELIPKNKPPRKGDINLTREVPIE